MKPMNYLSLLLSLAALGWGFWNHRRANEAEARLDNVRNSHFRLADQLREQVGQLEGELHTLQRQVRAVKGESLFHETMTIGEAIALDARAADVLGAFHIGGCSGCAVSPEDTIQQAATGNGQDLAKLLAALNQLATGQADEVQTMLERKPNVQLSL